MAGKIVIHQVRSAIGEPQRVKDTIRALGFKRHQQSVEKEDNPAIRGMIERAHHLLKVEEA